MIKTEEILRELEKIDKPESLTTEIGYSMDYNEGGERLTLATCLFGMGRMTPKLHKLNINQSLWHRCKEVTTGNFYKYLVSAEGIDKENDLVNNFILLTYTSRNLHANIASTIREIEKAYLGIKDESQFSRVASKVWKTYNNPLSGTNVPVPGAALTGISPNPLWLRHPLAFYFLIFFVRLAPYYDANKSLITNLLKISQSIIYFNSDKTVSQTREALPVLYYAYKNGLGTMFKSTKASIDQAAWVSGSQIQAACGPTTIGYKILNNRILWKSNLRLQTNQLDGHLTKYKEMFSKNFFDKILGYDLPNDATPEDAAKDFYHPSFKPHKLLI